MLRKEMPKPEEDHAVCGGNRQDCREEPEDISALKDWNRKQNKIWALIPIRDVSQECGHDERDRNRDATLYLDRTLRQFLASVAQPDPFGK